MKEIWLKNKWTLISVMSYLITVVLFANMTSYALPFLISSIIIIPYIQNIKIDSDSIIWNITSGFIFGVYLFVFSCDKQESYNSLLSFPYQAQTCYWFLLLFLNFCFISHRGSYLSRKIKEKYTENTAFFRDDKLDKLLSPTKRRFFQ